MLELGKSDQRIAREAMRTGQQVPERIANAPELRLGLQLYLEAFFDLDSERSHGNALTLIPWSRIAEYAELNEFDEEQRHALHFFVKKMDAANLKRLDEKRQNG